MITRAGRVRPGEAGFRGWPVPVAGRVRPPEAGFSGWPVPVWRRIRSAEAGFTLLEVLVALAILSLAVVVSIQAFAGGLRLLKLSGEHQEAMLVADQKAREVITPEAGQRDQGTEGSFAWERETRALPAPDLEVEGRVVKWRAYEIDVRVRWGERRELRLATLRTVAENPNAKPVKKP